MIRDKELHHGKIIAAAAAEFLEYGFADASMRRIASAAGLSVSGLYKHFAGKEEMFSALVEDAYLGMIGLYRSEEESEKKAICEGGVTGWDVGNDARIAMEYIYDHLDSFRLIICRSQGTRYEDFLHELAVREEETTLSFMRLLADRGVKLNDFSEKEFHLLATANVNAVFQAVEHGFTREEAMHYAETLDRFFSKAWKEFFGY